MLRQSKGNIEDRVSRIMASIPGPAHSMSPTDVDQEGNRLIQARDALMREAMEAQRRALLVGPLQAYTEKVPESKGTLHINKKFLGSMIREVSSHNRREEIADCWREHEMLKRARQTEVSISDERRLVSSRETCSSSKASVDEERRYWAQLKASKLSAKAAPLSSAAVSSTQSIGMSGPDVISSSDSSDSESVSRSSKSSDMKERKKRRKQQKAKRKHKKERKSLKKKSSRKDD